MNTRKRIRDEEEAKLEAAGEGLLREFEDLTMGEKAVED